MAPRLTAERPPLVLQKRRNHVDFERVWVSGRPRAPRFARGTLAPGSHGRRIRTGTATKPIWTRCKLVLCGWV